MQKILKAGAKLVGIGGKKKAADTIAAPAERKGPIVTPLGGSPASMMTGPRKRRMAGPLPTIIGEKLGG